MSESVNSRYPEEPCLWCKGTELDIWPDEKAGGFRAGCYGCGCRGPRKPTKPEAISAWNARADGNTDELVEAAKDLFGELFVTSKDLTPQIRKAAQRLQRAYMDMSRKPEDEHP